MKVAHVFRTKSWEAAAAFHVLMVKLVKRKE